MKVFLLAAGLGTRLRPLTDTLPKPLIEVAGKPLIVHSIEKFRNVGFRQFVINCHWHADKLQNALGDGSKLGIEIQWSFEAKLLNTAGGIIKAADLLGEQPFVLHNSDIWLDYDYQNLWQYQNCHHHHLILVPNPTHNSNGDFSLTHGQQLQRPNKNSYTYSGLSILTLKSILNYPSKCKAFSLGDVWHHAIANNQNITGEVYSGTWFDIGTVERLQKLEQYIVNLK